MNNVVMWEFRHIPIVTLLKDGIECMPKFYKSPKGGVLGWWEDDDGENVDFIDSNGTVVGKLS
jgi:hypothetical protein